MAKREKENKTQDKANTFWLNVIYIALVVFCIMGFICLITGDLLFGGVGLPIRSLYLGLLGYSAIPVLIVIIYTGILSFAGASYKEHKFGRVLVTGFWILMLLVAILHLSFNPVKGYSFGKYVSKCYTGGKAFSSTSFGGAIYAILTYPLVKFLSPVGAYIVLAILFVISVLIIIRGIKNRKKEELAKQQELALQQAQQNQQSQQGAGQEQQNQQAQQGQSNDPNQQNQQSQQANNQNATNNGQQHNAPNINDSGVRISQIRQNGGSSPLFCINENFGLKPLLQRSNQSQQNSNSSNNGVLSLFGELSSDGNTGRKYSESYEKEIKDKKSYILTPPTLDISKFKTPQNDTVSAPIKKNIEEPIKKQVELDTSKPKEGIFKPKTKPLQTNQQSLETHKIDKSYQNFFGEQTNVIDNAKEVFQTEESKPSQSYDIYGEPLNQTKIKEFMENSRNINETRFVKSKNNQKSTGLDLSATREEQLNKIFSQELVPDYSYDTPSNEDFSIEEDFKKEDQTIKTEENSIGYKNLTENSSVQKSSIAENPLIGDTFKSKIFDKSITEDQGYISENKEETQQGGYTSSYNQSSFSTNGRGPDRQPRAIRTDRIDRSTLQGQETKSSQDAYQIDVEEVNPYDLMPLDFRYKAPPLDLLKNYINNDDIEEIQRFNQEKSDIILEVFSNNNIDAEIVNILNGPTVSRFDISIPRSVSVKQVTRLVDDLNLWIAAQGNIRLIAPIPGSQRIGIEIPNTKRQTVGIREIVSSNEFVNAKKTSLTFALGKNLVGQCVCLDIAKMPHLLIGGATGTGKSVCLNTLITSLLMKYGPDELRIMIVDPKVVEFAAFEGIPHLMFNEMITSSDKAIAMLTWAVNEMENRYKMLYQAKVQNIDDYNEKMQRLNQRRMHRILIIVDEFADLMSSNKSSIEEKISRLAQKARAAGIHLILATQRPSVDIMVGSIKTNFTSRISFKMSNFTDSMTILTEGGAENLLGDGDCLYKTSKMFAVERVQGAFISKGEMDAVIEYVKENNECYYNTKALNEINKEASPQQKQETSDVQDSSRGGGDPGEDELVYEALRYVIESNSVSISKLQRKYRIGFNRAASIVDWMVENNYISQPLENKSRKVLISIDEYDKMMEQKQQQG